MLLCPMINIELLYTLITLLHNYAQFFCNKGLNSITVQYVQYTRYLFGAY